MTREDVIRLIVEREARGDELGEAHICREAVQLHSAACEQFGTWDTALRYAGVRRRQATKARYTPQLVLTKLRDMCMRGYDLSGQRTMTKNRPLYEAAREHFGTWRQALRAVGIRLEHAHPNSRIPRLDREAVIAAIRARQQDGHSLAYSDVCLENRDLLMMAKRTFGSWRRALLAAGIAGRSISTMSQG